MMAMKETAVGNGESDKVRDTGGGSKKQKINLRQTKNDTQ